MLHCIRNDKGVNYEDYSELALLFIYHRRVHAAVLTWQ